MRPATLPIVLPGPGGSALDSLTLVVDDEVFPGVSLLGVDDPDLDGGSARQVDVAQPLVAAADGGAAAAVPLTHDRVGAAVLEALVRLALQEKARSCA